MNELNLCFKCNGINSYETSGGKYCPDCGATYDFMISKEDNIFLKERGCNEL